MIRKSGPGHFANVLLGHGVSYPDQTECFRRREVNYAKLPGSKTAKPALP